MVRTYVGVVVRVAYVARKPEHDHVTVLDTNGKLHDCYRFQVIEVTEGHPRTLP